jgi:hypothetical protein
MRTHDNKKEKEKGFVGTVDGDEQARRHIDGGGRSLKNVVLLCETKEKMSLGHCFPSLMCQSIVEKMVGESPTLLVLGTVASW